MEIVINFIVNKKGNMMNKRKKCKVEKCNKYVNELSDGEPWVDHGLCLEHYEAKMKKQSKKRDIGIRGSKFG